MACYLLAIGEIVYGIINNDTKSIIAGIVTFFACQTQTSSTKCPIPPNYYCKESGIPGVFICGENQQQVQNLEVCAPTVEHLA